MPGLRQERETPFGLVQETLRRPEKEVGPVAEVLGTMRELISAKHGPLSEPSFRRPSPP